jgi:carboxyl-terminal processing protease
MTSRSRWLLFVVSTPLVVFAAVGGLLGANAAPPPQAQGFTHLRVFDDVVSLIMSSYVETVDADKVLDGAMRGLADSLDPMSAYLTPDEVTQAKSTTSLPAGDVGLTVSRQFYLRIVGVRDGSPAARAGLRTNDFIRGINGTPTREMSAFTGARVLRGAVGSTVELTVLRGNAAEPHVVTLTREAITTPAVSVQKHTTGVSVVRVASFAAGTAKALTDAVQQVQQAGGAGVVIDLRGTADGPNAEGVEAAKAFVKSGTLATLAPRSGDKNVVTAGAGAGALTLKVVLLVSNGTAGAAEVFAAALQGNTRADLVGEPTAGLAADQRLVPLPEGRGLWMTYAQYLAADGTPIHGRGLAPAVAVEAPVVPFGDEAPAGDEMLTKAIERLTATR